MGMTGWAAACRVAHRRRPARRSPACRGAPKACLRCASRQLCPSQLCLPPHFLFVSQVIEAGANAIVSGSGVFGASDYAAAIQVGR